MGLPAILTGTPEIRTETSPSGRRLGDVADLNFDNTDMRRAMIDAMKFWVNEAGVDGFGCDVAMMVPNDFWKQCVSALQEVKPDIFMLAGSRRA